MSDYRHEFVQAIRNGKSMRKCMFNVLEQRHATDFANGRNGVKLYNDLFDAVQESNVQEALEEFQARFYPMLDPDGSRARAAAAAAAASAAPIQSRRVSGWLVAGCCAAALMGGTVLGLKAFPSPPATSLTLAAAPAADAIAPEPKPIAVISEVTSEPKPTAVASETTTEPKPSVAVSEEATESQANAADPVKSAATSSEGQEQ